MRIASTPERVDRPAALLGLCVGLAALTAVGTLPALLLIPAAGLARAQSRQLRHLMEATLRPAAIACAAALAICGWWYARELAQSGGLALLPPPDAEAAPLRLAEVGPIATALLRSFWGLFGWGNVPAGAAFYSLTHPDVQVVGIIRARLGLLAPASFRSGGAPPSCWALGAALPPALVLGAAGPPKSARSGRMLFPRSPPSPSFSLSG